MLQNALKIFHYMPKSLMDIVKSTDPSTVTQHGLYMRPLTDPSLHPLVAKATPADAPGTPPKEEEQKANSKATADAAAEKLAALSTTPAESEGVQGDIQAASEGKATSQDIADPSKITKDSAAMSADNKGDSAASSEATTEDNAVPKPAAESPAELVTAGDEGWGKGRVSLLGDAAHATIPNGKHAMQLQCN